MARKITENGIMDKPSDYLKVWIYLLNKAGFKDRGNLKKGQCRISIDELRKMLSYKSGYRTEKPSGKKVRRIIDWLRCPHGGSTDVPMDVPMVVTTKVTHGMLLTICNYEFYQDYKNYVWHNGSPTGVPTGGQRVSNKGHNKKNALNEGNACNLEYPKDIPLSIAEEILEFALGLDFPSIRGTASRKKNVARINIKLKDGYSEQDIRDHLIRYINRKQIHSAYKTKYGCDPDIGCKAWCPLLTWSIMDVLSPVRIDRYYSVWEAEGLLDVESTIEQCRKIQENRNGQFKKGSEEIKKYCESDGNDYPPDKVYS